MQQLFKPAAAMLFILTAFIILSFTNDTQQPTSALKTANPKIQAAILLDVSGSMDGLIEQAKAQLWNMVNTMGKAKCDGSIAPTIEIALYEYGRSTNDVKAGYVKRLNGFIRTLSQRTRLLL